MDPQDLIIADITNALSMRSISFGMTIDCQADITYLKIDTGETIKIYPPDPMRPPYAYRTRDADIWQRVNHELIVEFLDSLIIEKDLPHD